MPAAASSVAPIEHRYPRSCRPCPATPTPPRGRAPLRGALLVVSERNDKVVRGGRSEEERVDPIEHTAVPAEQPAGVLHLEIPLQGRFEEIAEDGCDHHHEP